MPSRLLKSYLRCRYVVKNDLKMLIYTYKLRLFSRFCLVSAASLTLFNSLSRRLQTLKLRIQCWVGDPGGAFR